MAKLSDEVYSMDIIDKLIQEYNRVNFGCNPLKLYLTNVCLQKKECSKVDDLANNLDSQMPYQRHTLNENPGKGKGRPHSQMQISSG